MNHSILATDEMKEQIEELYLKAEDILEIAGTHKLRYSPWFRGIEREVERQMLWEMDNPAGMPAPQVRRDWVQYRELQEEFYIRLSKGLYGSGLQGQRKVAAVLAQIWLTLHRQFGLGGEFLCWLDLRFHVFLPLTQREKEELQAQREAEDLAMDCKEETGPTEVWVDGSSEQLEDEEGVDEEQPFVPYVKSARDWAPASLLQFLRPEEEEEAEEAQPWPDNRQVETRRSP